MVNKTKNDLQQGYLTHGNWPQPIRDFLQKTDGSYLEIGVYWGYFLAELAIEFPNKHVYGIDPFISDGWTGQQRGTELTDVETVCKANLEGLPNAKLFRCKTSEFLQSENINILKNVSCLLVDGSHHYDDIMIDINLFRLIKNDFNKLVIFDDLHIPDVKSAVDYFRGEFKDRITSEPETGRFILDGF